LNAWPVSGTRKTLRFILNNQQHEVLRIVCETRTPQGYEYIILDQDQNQFNLAYDEIEQCGRYNMETTQTSKSYLSTRVANLKPSGIRKFFDIVATMKDVISLGIGEPDFTTPLPILEAGVRSLHAGETHYTSNSGKIELRKALTQKWENLYGVSYHPEKEVLISVGGSEALYLACTAILNRVMKLSFPPLLCRLSE
jgi:DNA-binding transcriptional MocR family regulator